MKFFNNLVKLFIGKDDGLNGIRFLTLVLGPGVVFLLVLSWVGSLIVSLGVSQGAVQLVTLVLMILVMALLGGFAGQLVFMSNGQGKRRVK